MSEEVQSSECRTLIADGCSLTAFGRGDTSAKVDSGKPGGPRRFVALMTFGLAGRRDAGAIVCQCRREDGRMPPPAKLDPGMVVRQERAAIVKFTVRSSQSQ